MQQPYPFSTEAHPAHPIRCSIDVDESLSSGRTLALHLHVQPPSWYRVMPLSCLPRQSNAGGRWIGQLVCKIILETLLTISCLNLAASSAAELSHLPAISIWRLCRGCE